MSSERIAQLTWPAEVFYRRLMSVVDDFGRFYAKPELLRSAVYPLQFDKVGNQDIGKWLGDCLRAGLVRVYTFDNKEYLELLDFRQQVRTKHGSKFPECTADATQMHSTCAAHAHLDVDVVVDVDGAPKSRRRSPKTPLADGFALSERVRRWGAAKGYAEAALTSHFEYFILQAAAKGYEYSDWDSALIKAISDDWAKVGKGRSIERRLAV